MPVQPCSRKVTPFPDVGRHTVAILQRYLVTVEVMDSAVMQINELVGQVRQGTRLRGIDRALDDARTTLDTRKEMRDAEKSHRARDLVAGTTRMPRRYGAGF